jgi:geranyl-CoA carboxylase beta subunit
MGRVSAIATSAQKFTQNTREMLALVDHLRGLEARSRAVSDKRKPTFDRRGQVSPHDRIALLLDPGMPFLRLHTLANYLVEDDDPETSIPGASVIMGIGYVSGVRCMIWADDSGIRAGAYTPMTVSTALSIQDIALKQRLPLIHLVESAGANLMDFTVENWANAGRMFSNLARFSAAGVPTMTVLHGASTAGGAYMPGMSDYVVGVRNNGLAALAGVALVKAATGEEADERELGGSEMHASTSGLVEYLADDDAQGLMMARQIVSRWDWNRHCAWAPPESCLPPRYDADELLGIVPVDYKIPYDVREVLLRIVDDSDFDEFKPGYGSATVCVQASIMGYRCGVIGNNGPIDPQGATKAAQFMQLCDQAQLPLVFLHNITGYLVGTRAEQDGIIKHGAKMIQAVTNVRVPRISMYVSGSFGAGNYGMCGYGYDPDFLFAWPNSATNTMGGEQAARTMSQVARATAERKGTALDEEALAAQEAEIRAYFERQENAFYTAGRNLNHGIIDPRDSRRVLGFALGTCLEARARQVQSNSFGVGRL